VKVQGGTVSLAPLSADANAYFVRMTYKYDIRGWSRKIHSRHFAT